MNPERLTENERRQMEQIRELDLEELQIEEVDDDFTPSDDERNFHSGNDGGAGSHGGFTFNTRLASLHSYLGEIDDTHGRMAFLDGGAILNLPMFYLEGVVLFPEAILPLRVVQPRFIASVERALQQVNAPCTIGVVRVHGNTDDERMHLATTGTTAEIRQFRKMDDGSLNVVARGQQRFRMRRRWTDVEGAPCAEIQIVQEDKPLRTPKDAFGQLASINNSGNFSIPYKQFEYEDDENRLECMSGASTESDHSDTCMRMCTSASDSPILCQRIFETSSSDEELIHGRRQRLRKSEKHCGMKTRENVRFDCDSVESSPEKKSSDHGNWRGRRIFKHAKFMKGAQMAFWPQWVYQMYDSYALASRAADLWGQIIGSPRLDDYAKKPDLLSFYIASKLPVSESRRQELLEIDGISYRLQREIQLLKSFNLIRCKLCMNLIAKRSDMVVMSSDGPLNAYVNPHGYVHEVITVYNASGLVLQGVPVKEHSWFTGYAWTCTYCATCESNMGWRFTATKKNLLPRSFWGIRSCQVTDDTLEWEREVR